MGARRARGLDALIFAVAAWSALALAASADPSAPRALCFALAPAGALGALAVFLGPAWRRARRGAELALGPAVLALLALLVRASGGVGASPAQPLVGLWMVAVGALFAGPAALLTGAFGVGAALLGHLRGGVELPAFLAQLGYLALFGAVSATLHRGRVMALEARERAAVDEALRAVERDARDFRLIASSLGPASAAPRTLEQISRARQVGSVRAIREALLDVLEVARAAVRADTALLFLADERGECLRLAECVTREGEPPVPPGETTPCEGALGAVIKTGRPVSLLVKQQRGLGYTTQARVGAMMALPVLADGQPIGALAVDRASDDAFSPADEEVLLAVAREAARAMEAERIFATMDRAKYEQERFFEAFSLLNEALAVEAFADRLIEASARIKGAELIAVIRFDGETATHTVVAARAPDAALVERLRGATFPARDGGLVEMALKTGHTLPYVPLGARSDPRLSILGKVPLPALASVKVFPLVHHGEPLGALVVGSISRRDELSREEQRMLETVSAHASTTLANARLFARMEEMATTDGLTGAVNRRRFQEQLTASLQRAARFGRQVSVLMVDADHFKSINDTYGHPVGDLVLKRIARLLKAEARRTDVVARYGGEEFVVILDETGLDGAAQVAERIRERIEAETIQGDFGRVKVTASLGVATWPAHAETQELLLERADQALYEAKRRGRNRVVAARARGPSAARSAERCAPGADPAIGAGRPEGTAGTPGR
jgi:two-component system cell cycle response regulator